MIRMAAPSRRRGGPPSRNTGSAAELKPAPSSSLDQWFNDIGLSDLASGQEPPRKRARLDVPLNPFIADAIPVARISIALRSESSSHISDQVRDPEHFATQKVVGLLSVDQPEGQCATFGLASSRLRHRLESHHLVRSSARLTGQELEDIQRVVEIERRSRGTGKSYVAQSRCCLRRDRKSVV